jgi:transposase
MHKHRAQGDRRRSQKDYTVAFKLGVVAEIERGDLNKNQAKFRYGIQGRSTVLKWLKKYGTLDWTNRPLAAMSSSSNKTPEQRIKELEALLDMERKKNLLLNTMVDIAEKEMGLDIRKKSSTGQPRGSKKQGK